jgi:hypothetical protein
MKKLLFLGCNHDQVPYLKVAKNAGYYVVATDMNKDAPGVALADAWYPASYEDVSTLIGIGKKEGFGADDKVFTAGSQFAYVGASGFAEHFGIPFVPQKSVDTCLDKTKLYLLFEKYGLPVPTWHLYDGAASLDEAVQEFGAVFLKSDYGKSPNYCYRVTGKVRPQLPSEHDRYWRASFVMQKEMEGTHYRVNWINGVLYSLEKETDSVCRPAPSFSFGTLKESVDRMIVDAGLSQLVIKFDVIDVGGVQHFIDLGLDPPSRLGAYLTHAGYDFPRLYFKHIVEGKAGYPYPHVLPTNVVIRGQTVTAE